MNPGWLSFSQTRVSQSQSGLKTFVRAMRWCQVYFGGNAGFTRSKVVGNNIVPGDAEKRKKVNCFCIDCSTYQHFTRVRIRSTHIYMKKRRKISHLHSSPTGVDPGLEKGHHG